jgi:hypothetical protein
MTISNITYLDQLQTNRLFLFSNPSITRFYFQDYLELKQFLNNLEVDKTYIITFDFIMSWLLFEEESPVILLGKPILITKNSRATTISEHLQTRINLLVDTLYLDDNLLKLDNAVIVKYCPINLF